MNPSVSPNCDKNNREERALVVVRDCKFFLHYQHGTVLLCTYHYIANGGCQLPIQDGSRTCATCNLLKGSNALEARLATGAAKSSWRHSVSYDRVESAFCQCDQFGAHTHRPSMVLNAIDVSGSFLPMWEWERKSRHRRIHELHEFSQGHRRSH